MSFNNKPITAKIKRTTKGGMVQQPILNMGGPVKMKVSSPAKQGKISAERVAARKQAQADAGKNRYNKKIDQYKQDVADLKSGTAKGLGGYARHRIKDFSNELFDHDTKNKPGSTKGHTAGSYLEAKANNTYKKEESKTLTPKNLKARSEGEAGWAADDKARKNKTGIYKPTKGKKSYEQAYKDTRGDKVYGKMDKATYIKEAKRQNASKKAGKGYDAKGKGKDTPPRKKAVASTITPVGIKKVEMSTKLELRPTAKPTDKQIKKSNRKSATADKKDSRAQRVAIKAKEARTSGNTSKADRLDKREARIKKRASKKRGQAAGAIQPK